MSDSGYCDELPDDVMAEHERTAREIANLWGDGLPALRQSVLVALCRETLRVSRTIAVPTIPPLFRPEAKNG